VKSLIARRRSANIAIAGFNAGGGNEFGRTREGHHPEAGRRMAGDRGRARQCAVSVCELRRDPGADTGGLRFIGMSLVGVSLPGGGTLRVGVALSLTTVVVLYLLTFVIVYVLALIIDGLSSRFGGRPHFENALKLSVYSYTPFWLAGIFALHPSLSFLGILGLYGFYLLYVGLPVLMKAPRERALIYCVAVAACGIVLWFLVSLIPIAIMR
jgi:hypothetical protein